MPSPISTHMIAHTPPNVNRPRIARIISFGASSGGHGSPWASGGYLRLRSREIVLDKSGASVIA